LATVPEYFRNQLVSSQTGPNTLDTSAADTARSIAQMTQSFQNLAAKQYQTQKARTLKSESAKKQAEFINEYALAADEIKRDYASDPEGGYEVLRQRAIEIKEGVLGGVSDSQLQRDLTPVLDGLVAQQSINDRQWQIRRSTELEQQFLIDAQESTLNAVLHGVDGHYYDVMQKNPALQKENYVRAWGPEEGAKNFQTAQNAMFRARAAVLMEQGRFFEAQDFIQKSGTDTMEETGPDLATRREVEQSFIKMQKGAQARALFQTQTAASFDVVEAQEGMLIDDITPAELDDRVLQVSAQANEAPAGSQQQKTLFQYANVLAGIRDMKMENILLTAPGDTNVEAKLQSQYSQLFMREDGMMKADGSAYLEDFLNFQASIVEEAQKGNVSHKNYNKWMFWSKVALDGYDIKGGRLSEDGAVRKRLKAFVRETRNQSDDWKLTALRNVYESIPQGQDLSMLDNETVNVLFKKGKVAATLEQMGYPIDMVDAKVIKTSAGIFPVVDTDEDGMPILEVEAGK